MREQRPLIKNHTCETLRVVSDWVANAAARNEHDVMEYEDVFVSNNRGIRLLSERECKRNNEFPTVSAYSCNTRKLAKPYFGAHSISSRGSYLLDVVCCSGESYQRRGVPFTIVFVNWKVFLFKQWKHLHFALKKGKKRGKIRRVWGRTKKANGQTINNQ